MPNLTQSTALIACFFIMGMDTTALDEMITYVPSQEVLTVVKCDTDTDCKALIMTIAKGVSHAE